MPFVVAVHRTRYTAMQQLPQAAAHCIHRGERDVAGRRVAVLGLARSGLACVRFLAARGARVTALDARPVDELAPEARSALEVAERVAAPCASVDDLLPADMLVISPGVPTEAPLVREAREAGVEVIGEVELAYRFCDAPLAAVTGTCGKGTTVTTLGALLGAAGIPHVVAGNIGVPLISRVEQSAEMEVVVAEISSFQLETAERFHPHIAVLLNITEDHLERYPTFEAYSGAKQRMFRNQTPADWAILCVDDPRVGELVGVPRARVLTVSLRDGGANGRVEGEALVVQLPGEGPEVVAKRGDLALGGDHHVINALAAALAARLCGVPVQVMADALRAYEPAEHLMQPVGEVGGVRYIDDSKATNPASAVADLSGIEGPLIVIAGGKEKRTNFGEFGAALAARCKRVILLGECAERIERAVGRPGLCARAGTMEEAVLLAARAAAPGDTVILCPGCSSLDMFDDYADRGRAFAEAVSRPAAQSTGRE